MSFQNFMFQEDGTMSEKLRADGDVEKVSLQTASLETPDVIFIEEILPDGLS